MGNGMIIIIDALNQHKYESILEDMHRLRARVFHDRLGWEVDIKDGKEIDMFDNLHPAHVVSLDEAGHVVGCMRLLQTTGSHMLSDVFSSILGGEPPIRDVRTWEATRFCVDTERLSRGKTKNSISYVTSEVMIGAFEYAQQAGIKDAVAVIDPVMNRILKRSGNAPHGYVGKAVPMGKVVAMAALMDCSDTRIKSIRDFSGIEHDVFATEDMIERCLANRARSKPQKTADSDSDLHEYFEQQLRDAQDADEVDAVERLIRAVANQRSDDQPEICRRMI